MNNRCKVDKMINIDLLQMTVYNELQNMLEWTLWKLIEIITRYDIIILIYIYTVYNCIGISVIGINTNLAKQIFKYNKETSNKNWMKFKYKVFTIT